MNWSSRKAENSLEENFLETIKDCFVYHYVTEYTRCRGKDNPSLIDLIFTNEEAQVSMMEHHASLGKSDHSVFKVLISTATLTIHLYQ